MSMPGYLYGGEPFPVPQYFCGSGDSPAVIDTTQQYFFPNMRDRHTQTFSRFAYPYCSNGYCMGNQAKGYKTNPQCCTNDQPKDVAPERFYSWKHTSPYYADNAAYKASRAQYL